VRLIKAFAEICATCFRKSTSACGTLETCSSMLEMSVYRVRKSSAAARTPLLTHTGHRGSKSSAVLPQWQEFLKDASRRHRKVDDADIDYRATSVAEASSWKVRLFSGIADSADQSARGKPPRCKCDTTEQCALRRIVPALRQSMIEAFNKSLLNVGRGRFFGLGNVEEGRSNG
jgi:hypothetical protein